MLCPTRTRRTHQAAACSSPFLRLGCRPHAPSSPHYAAPMHAAQDIACGMHDMPAQGSCNSQYNTPDEQRGAVGITLILRKRALQCTSLAGRRTGLHSISLGSDRALTVLDKVQPLSGHSFTISRSRACAVRILADRPCLASRVAWLSLSVRLVWSASASSYD